MLGGMSLVVSQCAGVSELMKLLLTWSVRQFWLVYLPIVNFFPALKLMYGVVVASL